MLVFICFTLLIDLFSIRFSTETGSIGTFVPAEIQQDEWQYFKVSPHIDVEMVPQEGPDGVFMPVVLVRTAPSELFSLYAICRGWSVLTNESRHLRHLVPMF